MDAKVDIRKLQLLNDRINQTIDALNQVRMSVHGLSHSTGNTAGYGYPGTNLGSVMGPVNAGPGINGLPFPAAPFFGTTPWQVQGQIPFGQTGISHTNGVNPFWQQQGWAQQNWGPTTTPFGTLYGQTPWAGQTPWGWQGGLAHSNTDTGNQTWNGATNVNTVDPYTQYVQNVQSRFYQAFPYAQWAQTPYGWY